MNVKVLFINASYDLAYFESTSRIERSLFLYTRECEMGGHCSQVKGLVGERSSTSFTRHINES